MPDTQVDSDLNVEEWADTEFEYVRESPLSILMGTDESSVIQIKEDLTKEAGDQITFGLVNRLTGTGVVDDNMLEGNEEALGNRGCKVTVHQLRHGVVVGAFEKIKTKIDLLNAARTMLKIWNKEQLRNLFLARLLSPCTDGLTTYAAATEVQKDAWCAANNPDTGNERILFGAAKSNYSGDHSADLAKIDGTADDAHQSIIRLLKRLAQSASPHIRPVLVPGSKESVGGERFYALMGSLPYRDLQANFETVLSNADVRGEKNLIFTGDRMKIGNVICLEVPEMDNTPANGGCLLENVGDSATTEVEPIFLVGAQALLLAWAAHMSVKTDDWDYQNRRGVAVAEIRECRKATYNSYQHGLVTGYVSAVGD
jgi:N4-gp56 family major capsid protein